MRLVLASAAVVLMLAVAPTLARKPCPGNSCHPRPTWTPLPSASSAGSPAPIATATPPASFAATIAPTAIPAATVATTAAPTVGVPTPSPYTFDDECDARDARWVSLLGPGDPGDRLDTDMMGDLSQWSVANGLCTITVERKQTPSGRPFAGAYPATYGTFGQRYGTFEARIRYDEAKGTWPSFFLLPVGQKGPYPEIDVFEAYGDPYCLGPGALVQTLHYGAGLSYSRIVPVSTGWHVHRIVWTATRLDFSIDGALTFSITSNVPQVAMYPIFVNGDGAHAAQCRADATTPTTRMDIDYVRVSA